MSTSDEVCHKLKVLLQLSVSLYTFELVLCLYKLGQHQLSESDEKLLLPLRPPKYSSYDMNRRCLPGTRVQLIRDVMQWSLSTDRDAGRLFCLHGVAGCGKSSVAASVASELEHENVSSYSFFCKRDDPERRDPVRILHAIAYYLAKAVEPYSTALLRELRKDSTILDKPLQNQFNSLLVERIKELPSSASLGLVVFVIDALDECEESDVISTFLMELVGLAPWVKFIVTSRPLPGLHEKLESAGRLTTSCDLFTISAEDDILLYTKEQFKCDRRLAVLREDIDSNDIEKLAQKALGLFIWISVVCSYIGRLKLGKLAEFRRILNSKGASDPEKRLDELYLQVLRRAAGSDGTSINKYGVRIIVGLVNVTSRNRALPAGALLAFRPDGLGSQAEWMDLLRDLGSVLTTDPQTGTIRVSHESFLDFLGDESRAQEFWTEPNQLERIVAERCMQIMLSELKFNICGVQASEVPKDLKVDKHIPRELQYSSLYWLDHLSKCAPTCTTEERIQHLLRSIFCQAKALYWLEALSLLSELKAACGILQKFGDMLKVC